MIQKVLAILVLESLDKEIQRDPVLIREVSSPDLPHRLWWEKKLSPDLIDVEYLFKLHIHDLLENLTSLGYLFYRFGFCPSALQDILGNLLALMALWMLKVSLVLLIIERLQKYLDEIDLIKDRFILAISCFRKELKEDDYRFVASLDNRSY